MCIRDSIITSLRPGIIKVTNSDQTQSLFVEEGFIKFSNNELLVIAVGLDEEAALNNDFINDKIENYSSALETADETQKMNIQKKIDSLKLLLKGTIFFSILSCVDHSHFLNSGFFVLIFISSSFPVKFIINHFCF